MSEYKLIKKIHMECPICDKIHDLEERKRIAHIIIKDELVSYEETYYFCENSGEDENIFATVEMEKKNLLNARNAYRIKHGLLTSKQIAAIREKYGFSQVDMAKHLGLEDNVISRYESKTIQDEAIDSLIRAME